ncbi:uncharacterized protein BDR25DRAFT_382968 [Lindgomyces ingoldianus]|uniref:Uncharacterized protein n=1 Tax=Lindgomyces ingoldianus TaxID=673940 RepID=A0ACB6QAF9_9PLEO|nr:uncharacterized protein BDR25DRAFT_382968 [Lindgomyces ingoldianus]KAF2463948.1 hypothetical protein BDR25DRAFT_382968 [Lindgomyces ingoldianus]
MPRLNKAKRAARSRAAALRGRAARKPAPTTPRRAAPTPPRRPARTRKPAPTTPHRPAPTTPRRRPLPGPASTPRRPPPGALRVQSCLGCIKSALAGRSSGECHDSATGGSRCWRCSSGHSCLPLPPVAVVYARRLVAALVAEDERAAS